MVYLKKKTAGNAPGYEWPEDGAVVDVDDELAQELLERPGDEFTEAQPADSEGDEPEAGGEEQADSEGETPDEDAGDTAEAKKPSRRRTKISE